MPSRRNISDIDIWNVTTGQLVKTLTGHRMKVHSMVLSPDGKLLASSSIPPDSFKIRSTDTCEIKVWDVQTGKPIYEHEDHTRRYVAAAFDPLGPRVAFAGMSRMPNKDAPAEGVTSRHLAIVNYQNKTLDPLEESAAAYSPLKPLQKVVEEVVEKKRAERGSNDLYMSVAYSRDGRSLAVGHQNGKVLFWNVNDPVAKPGIRAMPTLPAPVFALVFSSDGKRLFAATRLAVHILDAQNGQLLLSLEGAPRASGDPGFNPWIALSPDGTKLAANNWNGSISIWSAAPAAARLDAMRTAAFGRTFHWSMKQVHECLELGRLDQARLHLIREREHAAKAEDFELIGNLLGRLGDMPNAAAALAEGVRLDPGHLDLAYRNIAVQFLTAGPEAARNELRGFNERFGNLDTPSQANMLVQANTLLSQPIATEAQMNRWLTVAVNFREETRWTRLSRAMVLHRTGHSAEAAKLIDDLLGENGQFPVPIEIQVLGRLTRGQALCSQALTGETRAMADQALAFYRDRRPKRDLHGNWQDWVRAEIWAAELTQMLAQPIEN